MSLRPRGWKWPERKATRVVADEAYLAPNVTPIRPTDLVEASRWPVAGCIVAIGATTGLILTAWYLIWRLVVRVSHEIMRLT